MPTQKNMPQTPAEKHQQRTDVDEKYIRKTQDEDRDKHHKMPGTEQAPRTSPGKTDDDVNRRR